MVEKPYLAKFNGMRFRNFGHKQGIQVHKRNPLIVVQARHVLRIDEIYI